MYVMGENGIIKKAQRAKEETETAVGQEKDEMQNLLNKANDILEGVGGGSTPSNPPTNSQEPSNPPEDPQESRPETIPYLPNNTFSYIEENLEEGLVTQDASGNEYVWVEVPTSIYNNNTYNSNGSKKPSNSEDSENIEYCLQTYAVDYRQSGFTDEYYANSSTGWYANATDYYNDKNAMLKSVYENGGFWIGRYKAGLTAKRTGNSNTEKTDPSTLPTPIIEQNAYPYNHVTQTQAKVLANRLSTSDYKCNLIYGIQWDLTLKYLESKGTNQEELKTDSTAWGNYNNNRYTSETYQNGIINTLAMYSEDNGANWTQITVEGYKKNADANVMLTTGAHPEFKKQNIYDLAGNVWELTLEKYTNTTPCTDRGGSYLIHSGSKRPAAVRGYDGTSVSASHIGFRIALYK